MRAVLIQTAKAWGKKPSELGLCTAEDDLVYMVAWDKAEMDMMAWERQQAEREAKREARRGK